MASITVRSRSGKEVTIELAEGETSAQAAERLDRAVKAAGGWPEPRRHRWQRKQRKQEEKIDPRHAMMQQLGLLECKRCKNWIPPTQAAIEHHDKTCTGERTPN